MFVFPKNSSVLQQNSVIVMQVALVPRSFRKANFCIEKIPGFSKKNYKIYISKLLHLKFECVKSARK